MNPITEKQVRLIRFLVSKLGWSEESYKDFLHTCFKVEHTKELSIRQAAAVIDILNEEKLGCRQMATPGQVKYIVEHWKLIDYDVMQYGDKHLHAFLERKFNVTSVYDLTKKQASGAIAAIRAMEKKSHDLAVKKAIAYEEQLNTPIVAQAQVTLDGRALVNVATPEGKVLSFQLSMKDHGRPN